MPKSLFFLRHQPDEFCQILFLFCPSDSPVIQPVAGVIPKQMRTIIFPRLRSSKELKIVVPQSVNAVTFSFAILSVA